MAKVALTDMTIAELMDYEKAARIICTKYEKSALAWGTDTVRGDYSGSNEFQEYYKKYKNIYDKVVEEIEKRLDNIKL